MLALQYAVKCVKLVRSTSQILTVANYHPWLSNPSAFPVLDFFSPSNYDSVFIFNHSGQISCRSILMTPKNRQPYEYRNSAPHPRQQYQCGELC